MAGHLALLLAAAASLGLARSSPASASRVCVKNTGSFVLSFDLWNTADNLLSTRSRSIHESGQSCLDLSTLDGIMPGNPVITVVHANARMSRSLPPLLYSNASDAESTTANFVCTGTPPDFSCTQNGETVDDQSGSLVAVPSSQQVRAKHICVHNTGDLEMKIRLWDTATGTLGAWSKGFNIFYAGPDLSKACVDGGSLPGVARGHPLVLIADPERAQPLLVRSVLYDPDAAGPVTVECDGVGRTGDPYSCEFQGVWPWRRLQVLV